MRGGPRDKLKAAAPLAAVLTRMASNCDYCHSALEEGVLKCPHCGAGREAREAPDFRYCPHCRRRLLALGSPACNYCGRALPEEYLKVREAMRQRIGDVGSGRADAPEAEELERESDDALKRALKALFDLK